MNNFPMDVSDKTPYMIIIRLGGIKKPSVPAPAKDPNARSLSYPRFDSSSKVILPTVAVVAALEPETAAKREQATMFMWSNFPGIRENQGKRPFKSLVEIAVLYKISPINTNNGRAVRDHESMLFQTEFAIKFPILLQIQIVGGRLKLYNNIPQIAAAIKENPIHSPDRRNKNIIPNITMDRISGSLIIFHPPNYH